MPFLSGRFLRGVFNLLQNKLLQINLNTLSWECIGKELIGY